MKIEEQDIRPPGNGVYNDWWTELSCEDLLGEDWEEHQLDFFEPEESLELPEGWSVKGWEYYPHKDAAGLVAVYFHPPAGTERLYREA